MKVGSQLYLTPEEAICTCRQKIDISEYVKTFYGAALIVFSFSGKCWLAVHK